MPHTFKGVIFDMDGLTLDTEPIYRRSLQQAAAELGISLEDRLHDRLHGRSIADWRATLVQTFEAEYPRFASRRQLWERHIQERGVAYKWDIIEGFANVSR
jgi:beta-phosphoglucomutase-like phosphatase (HAD superfamily)